MKLFSISDYEKEGAIKSLPRALKEPVLKWQIEAVNAVRDTLRGIRPRSWFQASAFLKSS